MFHRNNDCCDSCGSATVAPAAPTGEPIAPPKKMPNPAPMKEVRIDSGLVPAPVPTIVPGLEPAPAPVPNIDADNKN